MTTHRGNSGKAKIGGSNTVAELTAVEISESAAVIDDSQLSDDWDTHLIGSKSWKGTMTCWWDETDAAGQEACVIGAPITFGFYPAGDGSGATYRSGSGTVTSVGHTVARNQTVGRTIEVTGNGPLAQATV